MAPSDSLQDYREKRDFRSSPEPAEDDGSGGTAFVIQKHDASSLHDELSDVSSRRYTAKSLFKGQGPKDDPWAGIDEQAVSLDEPQRQLEEMDDA